MLPTRHHILIQFMKPCNLQVIKGEIQCDSTHVAQVHVTARPTYSHLKIVSVILG